MADGVPEEVWPVEERIPRDPASTLRIAVLAYVVVNLALGVPLLLSPAASLEAVGVDAAVAAQAGIGRIFGAMLTAWGMAGLVVASRPVGRAYFVTAGAFQLALGAVALVFGWAVGDGLGAVWFQTSLAVVLVGSAIYLWWARVRARGLM